MMLGYLISVYLGSVLICLISFKQDSEKHPEKFDSNIVNWRTVIKIISMIPIVNSVCAVGIIIDETKWFFYKIDYRIKINRQADKLDRFADNEKDEGKKKIFRNVAKALRELKP